MFGANPASIRPAAKISNPTVSGTIGPRLSAQPPATAMANRLATEKAVKPQPYSASPSRSLAAVGIAVITPMPSKAAIDMTATTPNVNARYCGAKMLPVASDSTSALTRPDYGPCSERRPLVGHARGLALL